MLKAFLFEVWNGTITKEVLVIATDKEKATDKLIISEDEDYELMEELEYDDILV